MLYSAEIATDYAEAVFVSTSFGVVFFQPSIPPDKCGVSARRQDIAQDNENTAQEDGGGSILGRQHDCQHPVGKGFIGGVFRTGGAVGVVVVEFPEDLLAFDLNRAEVVLTPWVVVF